MHHHVTARANAGLLLAALLVPLTGSSAGASPGCVDESPPVDPVLGLPTGDGCDDDTPPDTAVTATTPPNAAGLVATATMIFTVAAQVPDSDPGPFGLECRLDGPAQAHDWRPCTSPVTYAGLPDAPAGSWTFSARAVDLGDTGRTPDNVPFPPTTPDVPDLDATPATITWGQDTTAPFVFVTPDAYDEDTPTQPVVVSRSVPIRLNTNEGGASFECTDNERPVVCSGGRWTLEKARSGRHVFSARVVDRAGNTSEWSDPVEFFVPTNILRSKGWRTLKSGYAFDGDLVQAERRGLRLVLPRTTVGELRLVAPTDPTYGKVRIRVGKRAWHVVDLGAKRSRSAQLVVIDRCSGVRSGRIVIETLSRKPVFLDAVVARPNRFPAAQDSTQRLVQAAH